MFAPERDLTLVEGQIIMLRRCLNCVMLRPIALDDDTPPRSLRPARPATCVNS